MSRAAAIALAIAVTAACGTAPAHGQSARKVTDFSFIHASDTHAPESRSAATIATIQPNKPIDLTPYRTTAPAPEFAIVTGDITEFGGSAAGASAFETARAWWKPTGLEVRFVMGNHDATWDCLRSRLRALQGGSSLAFERHGVKFLLLDSTTPQDPRPSFSAEVLTFVRAELARTPLDQPLVLAAHHPPDGGEFASAHDHRRLFDLLEGRPVAAFLVGHLHTAWERWCEGVVLIGGGSTFPKGASDRGYNVVAFQGGHLRVAFVDFAKKGEMRPIFEGRIGGVVHDPLVVGAPRSGESFDSAVVSVQATVREATVLTATAVIEGRGDPVPLRVAHAHGQATVDGQVSIVGLPPGDHVLLVTVRLADGQEWIRTVPIEVATGSALLKRRFRVELAGSIRALRLAGSVLLAGCGDGALVGLSPADGHQLFVVRTGGEILSRPLVMGDVAIFSSGDGRARAIDFAGRVRWETDLGAPAYAEPVKLGELVICGTNLGTLVAIDPATGVVRWSAPAAKYAIEAGPRTDGQRLIVGAWDEYVRSFVPDGDWTRGLRLEWAKPGAGAAVGAPGVRRYYSPADAPPAMSGELAYVADRAYQVAVLDRRTGETVARHQAVAAVSPAAEPGRAWLRGTGGSLQLVAKDEVVWTIAVETGHAPIPPVLVPGSTRVVVLSDRGVVSLVKPGEAKPVAVRAASIGSFTLATPEVGADVVFVGSLDGSITALDLPRE